MKKHNFYAGPSILSQYTIKNTAEAVLDFAGTGLSILESCRRTISEAYVRLSSTLLPAFSRVLNRLDVLLPRTVKDRK